MEATLQTAVRVGATMSIVGDLVIVHGCWLGNVGERKPNQRILTAMGVVNLAASLAYLLGDVLMVPPKGTASQAACNFQGFVIQISVAVPLLTAFLATNYLLAIRYRWEVRRLERLRRLAFFAIAIFSSLTAIIPLIVGGYANAGPVWCWVTEQPPLLRFVLFYGPLWACICYTVFVMGWLVKLTVAHDVNMRKLNSSRSATGPNKFATTKRTLRQATLYCVVFILAWLLLTVVRIRDAVMEKNAAGRDSPQLALAAFFFVTLQGFFNMIIFILPRIVQANSYPHARWTVKLRFVFSLTGTEDLDRDASHRASERQTETPKTTSSTARESGHIPASVDSDAVAQA